MGASVKHAGERMGDDDHMHVVPVLARPDCELSQGWFGVCHAMVDRISCRRPRLCLLLPGPPTRCDRAGHSARGVINQFVGDETFVAFGAPIPLRDCVEKAAQCALAMIERMQAINDSLGKVISKPAYAGIGLRYGPVIAGNLGSENHLSYSITGDTVNTAKRIESLAPAGQNTVLMSDAAYDQLGGAAVVSN